MKVLREATFYALALAALTLMAIVLVEATLPLLALVAVLAFLEAMIR